MISNQILQSTIDGIRNISRVELSVMDVDGKEMVSTFDMSDCADSVVSFAASLADSQEAMGYQFFKIYDEQHLEYILVAAGSGEEVYTIGKIAAFQIQNLLVAYKERFDKDNFIKNLLLDNMLLVDIYSRSKKLHIKAEVPRSVVLIELKDGNDNTLMDLVTGFVTQNVGTKDFVSAVDETNIIIVHELTEADHAKELTRRTGNLFAFLKRESTKTARISYGTVVTDIREVSRSYKEAKMALDVGKIFFDDRDIIAYSELGIGRLIYQLPLPLCRMFIREIFGGRSPDEFDEETLTTIDKFFENNLNVSETSRQLFIHRNTLVYRLDKLQKSSGLDIRVFDDAITFKIALMVVKYMRYMEKLDL